MFQDVHSNDDHARPGARLPVPKGPAGSATQPRGSVPWPEALAAVPSVGIFLGVATSVESEAWDAVGTDFFFLISLHLQRIFLGYIEF